MAVNINLYTVYIHKNKINNKIYVGQTCQDLAARWKNGNGYQLCTAFYRAIQKYGWDNFEHIIIATKLTKEEADIQEQKLIALYKSNNKKYGYNIRAGGSKGALSKETIEKIRQSNLGKKYNISEEGRLKLREMANLNRPSKEKMKEIMSAYAGFNNPRSKPVLCVETGQIFGFSGEVERKLGISARGVRAACSGSKGQKTAGGYHWNFIDKEEFNYGN